MSSGKEHLLIPPVTVQMRSLSVGHKEALPAHIARKQSLGSMASSLTKINNIVADTFLEAEQELRRRQSLVLPILAAAAVVGAQPATAVDPASPVKEDTKTHITRRISSYKSMVELLLVDDPTTAADNNLKAKKSAPTLTTTNDAISDNAIRRDSKSIVFDAIHFTEMRKSLYENSHDGVHVTKEVFTTSLPNVDKHLVLQIWKHYSIRVHDTEKNRTEEANAYTEEPMIAINDICSVWKKILTKHDSSVARLDFLCTLLDTDADGSISKTEFADFLIEASGSLHIDKAIFHTAVDIIFAGKDELTYAEVRVVLGELGLDKLVSVSSTSDSIREPRETKIDFGTSTSAAGKKHLSLSSNMSMEDEKTTCCLCCECCTRRYSAKNSARIVWMCIFFIGLACNMAFKYWRYCNNNLNSPPSFFTDGIKGYKKEWGWTRPDTTKLMGYGVCFARSGSQGSMWCVCCLLFPICRGFLVRLRAIPGLWRIIPFDDRILFHKVAAWSLLGTVVVHVVAHLYNYSLYHVAPDAVWNTSVLGLNSGLPPQPDYWQVALLTLPGLTGHVMLLVMILCEFVVVVVVWVHALFVLCPTLFYCSFPLLFLFSHVLLFVILLSYCLSPFLIQRTLLFCLPISH